jgi:hypothetical protein
MAAPVQSPDVTEAFPAHGCHSIDVFTPTNLTSSSEATDLVRKCFAGQLRALGYKTGSPSDARMFVTIENWSRRIDASRGASSRRVGISAKLYDVASGDLLWSNEEWIDQELDEPCDDEEEPDDWLDGLVGGAVDWAIGSATDWITEEPKELAKDCVRSVLSTLPRAGSRLR